jgi:predicted ArsR family transcriptional regulator
MSRDRGESGEFTERVTLEDVIGVFDVVEGPAITSADVAESLDCTTETARRKLKELHKQERVDSRKTAGRVIWWRTFTEDDDAPPVEVKDPAPAEPLRALVGMGDEGTADRMQERSQAFRDEVDERMRDD